MKEFRIRFADTAQEISVTGGTLAEACAEGGHPLELLCGGNGTCGKCMVTVERENGERQQVLACVTPVDGDMTVFFPETAEKISARILTDGDAVLSFAPAVSKEYRPAEALTPDHCGAFLETAPLPVLRKFSRLMRDVREKGVTFVRYEDRIVDIQAGNTVDRLYGCAVDIGTTTVAVYIYNLVTGRLLTTLSALNEQIQRGADVIARIQYTLENDRGAAELSRSIHETVNALLEKAEAALPDLQEHLYHLVFCGNSTMQHLFLGLEPAALGADPFANITACGVTASAAALDLRAPADAVVEFLPLQGGFVGADTTAVLLGVPSDESMYLAVDLGTNGEIALGNGTQGFFTASTACGPALEGGCIACGMRGTDGAIDKLCIREDGTVEYHVLGGGTPRGLCGSGIIDTVAALLRAGLIDPSGRLLPAEELPEAQRKSPLAARLGELEPYNTAFYITKGDAPVYLSQKDVRQIQLAKSAICAGCLALLQERGVAVEDVRRMYLAGAFGNYIDVDNALYLGLLPPVAREKIRAVGNGAGRGAQACLLDREELARAERLREISRHVELNASPYFMEAYILNMNFEP